MFNDRLVYKAQKSSKEVIVKLMMNSCYGKSILKASNVKNKVV